MGEKEIVYVIQCWERDGTSEIVAIATSLERAQEIARAHPRSDSTDITSYALDAPSTPDAER